MNEDERREAASRLAERLTGGERLPYTLAVHRGGTNGENPHAHLMFSERGKDGIERSGEQWFKRYNAKAGDRGDRVEGKMESLIQGRVRSRDRGGPDR